MTHRQKRLFMKITTHLSFLFVIIFTFKVQTVEAQEAVLTLAKGHTAPVSDASITSDNRYIVSGARDNSVKVWDRISQKEIASFAGEKGRGAYSFVAISPDGKYVFRGGSSEFSIGSFDTKKWVTTFSLNGFAKDIFVMPDSKKVYFRNDEGSKWSLMVVDLTTLKISKVATGKECRRGVICYAPNGSFLLYCPFGRSGGKEKFDIVKMYLETGKSETLLSPNITSYMDGIAVLEDGSKGFFWTESGQATVFNTQTGSTLADYSVGVHNKITFSPDATIFATREESKGGNIYFYDTKSSKKLFATTPKGHQIISNSNENILSGRFSNDGKYLVSTGEDAQVLVWSAETGAIDFSSKAKSQASGTPTALQFSPNQQYLIVDDWSNRLVFWDLTKGEPTHLLKDYRTKQLPSSFSISPDGRFIAGLDDNQHLSVFDAISRKKIKQSTEEIEEVFWLNTGKLLARIAGEKEQYVVFDSKTLANPLKITETQGFLSDKYAVSATQPKLALSHDAESQVKIFDLTDGTNIDISKDGGILKSMTFTPDGSKLLIVYNHSSKDKYYINVHDVKTGKKVNTTNILQNLEKTQISPNGRFLVGITGASESDIAVYDAATLKPLNTLKGHTDAINTLQFSSNNKLLVSGSKDNTTRLWQVETQKALATLVTFPETNDWAVVTADGRFDASDGAQTLMYFTKGKSVLPLSSLFESFYTPHLLARILKGEQLAPPAVDVNGLKSPPTVKFLMENSTRNLTVENDVPTYFFEKEVITLKVQADCPSDAVTEIRLFQNGKLVETTRNLVVEDDNTEGSKTMTKTFTVSLNQGQNAFRAIAINGQRTESNPEDIFVNYKPKTPSVSDDSKTDLSLHVVIIGINNYKNAKYNLNYALADAKSFKETLEKAAKPLFKSINTVLISDENATKEGISNAMNKVKTTAQSKDVFIFYYAGHGVLNEKKEFFLVPHDVTQLYGNDDALAQKGLSTNLLQRFSKEIKAQKQLFILDACQSAGALETLAAARGAAEEKAIAQLARATGTHWLTASGSEQFASEFAQLGHGTFTYVLLEALGGKADKGGDKKVTVKELDAYLQEVVPELTAKHKGTPQYPASYGFGNDFPIGVVKN
jgi:WD40 repeat protein